jgi:hypothetical protein
MRPRFGKVPIFFRGSGAAPAGTINKLCVNDRGRLSYKSAKASSIHSVVGGSIA